MFNNCSTIVDMSHVLTARRVACINFQGNPPTDTSLDLHAKHTAPLSNLFYIQQTCSIPRFRLTKLALVGGLQSYLCGLRVRFVATRLRHLERNCAYTH